MLYRPGYIGTVVVQDGDTNPSNNTASVVITVTKDSGLPATGAAVVPLVTGGVASVIVGALLLLTVRRRHGRPM
jgi:LPXTG-motif cell wall-anchored protein